MTRISLIIPVLNEGASLRGFLERLHDWRALGHELILVDGGSYDGSPEIAAPYVDQLCQTQPCRAGQMNYGAERANGDVLLFLHADTQLPERGLELLLSALTAGAEWGWFDVRFDNPAPVFKVIAGFMNRRARWTRVCTGDQALFVTREMFDRVGGFPQQSLMEDVEISKCLRQYAEPTVMSAKVETASRRWQQRGIVATILLMWDLRLRYFLGQSPESLHARYYPKEGHRKYAHARLVVFAKQALPGQVKTRLIPALGEEGATSLHRAMVERVASIVSHAQLAPWRFAIAGELDDPLFAGKGADLPPLRQRGNDLGERMANAVEESFAEQGGEGKVEAVILLGADCPAIDSSVIEKALATLARGTEVVFVPAEDGGYVLLGLRRPMPCLFYGMPWGTSAVLRMSIERLEEMEVDYHCLSMLWDVDVPADLDRLAQLDPPLVWRRT